MKYKLYLANFIIVISTFVVYRLLEVSEISGYRYENGPSF